MLQLLKNSVETGTFTKHQQLWAFYPIWHSLTALDDLYPLQQQNCDNSNTTKTMLSVYPMKVIKVFYNLSNTWDQKIFGLRWRAWWNHLFKNVILVKMYHQLLQQFQSKLLHYWQTPGLCLIVIFMGHFLLVSTYLFVLIIQQISRQWNYSHHQGF